MGKYPEDIVDDIRRYYISPSKYLGDEHKVQSEIQKLDEFLLGDSAQGEENIVFDSLCETYKKSDNLEQMIRVSLDGEGGASSTKNYKEIYFNEIIQNANDNINENEPDAKMDITVEKIPWDSYAEGYRISFCYPDKGFHVKDIIGFFGAEIHNKKKELVSTGKHGVGIKSLFYFVEHLRIKSNVEIDININKQNKNGEEKIGEIDFSLSKPREKWNQKTVLTIEFPKKERYDEDFHVEKLVAMIDTVLEGNDDRLKDYFFSEEQEKLVFDLRGLLFTDKNAGKSNGIKEIRLNRQYTLSCKEESCVEDFKEDKSNYWACSAQLALFKHTDNEEKTIEHQKYILLTIGETGEQNFSIAFPDKSKIKPGKPRYYETYYIPYSDGRAELEFNFLINSEYSDVSRTKLTDQDDALEVIHQKIKEKVIRGLKYITSGVFLEKADKKLKMDVSLLFYNMLMLDFKNVGYDELNFTRVCCEEKISNRYLLKYKKERDGAKDACKYLVYKREGEGEELYEKKAFGQEKSVDEVCAFMEKEFLKEDSIAYSEKTKERFLDETRMLYGQAFETSDKKNYMLRKVLNAAGDVHDLIYYRIRDGFPDEEMPSDEKKPVFLQGEKIDDRSKEIYEKTLRITGIPEKAKAAVEDFLLIIGRYGLNEGISINGDITEVPFYEYIFAKHDRNESSHTEVKYPSFQLKGEELYQDYQELRSYLQMYLVNQNAVDCDGKIFKKAAKRQEYVWQEKNTRQLCRYWNRTQMCTGYACFHTSCHGSASIMSCDFSDIENYEPKFYDEKSRRKLNGQFMELLLCNDCNNELVNHVKQIGMHWYLYYKDYTYNLGDESEDEGEKGGYIYGTVEGLKNTFSYYYQMAIRLKLINLDFLTETHTDNWEEFKYYYKAFEKMRKNGLFRSKICLNCFGSQKTDNCVKMKSDNLTEVFRFFYEEDRYLSTDPISSFYIQLEDKPSVNLCKEDMAEFIEKIAHKKVYVMQTNRVQNKKEIMYAHGGKLYVITDWSPGRKKEIGGYTWPQDQGEDKPLSLIIVHNDKLDSLEAIRKTLICLDVESDIVQKCGAFIPNESIYPIQGHKYNEFKDCESDVNVFHRTEDSWEGIKTKSYNQSALSCESLKKIILARGNNDGKCACCKNRICNKDETGFLDGGESQLVIMNNQNERTKEEYPQIYEAVCERCKDILSKSLKEASIERENGKDMVVCKCVAENNHQKKEVVWKSVLYPGIAALCRVNC